MIKIIFLDFDETTYSHKINKIPDSAIEAIKMAQKNNVKVFLSTGRSKSELEKFDTSKVKFDGFVYNNGQVVADKNNNFIYLNPIKGKLKDTIINYFKEKRLPVIICKNNGDIFVNKVNDHFNEVMADVSSSAPIIKDYENEEFIMAAVYFTDKKDEIELMSLKDVAEVTYWHEGAVDLVPIGTSKSSGIDKAIEYLNINIEETMAIGDGDNDKEMIKHCGIGIAMGNSKKEIKDISDYVTSDINDDGLYKAFKHFNII